MDAAGSSPPRTSAPPRASAARIGPLSSPPSTFSPAWPAWPVRAAGALAVPLLRALGAIPVARARAILSPALPLYPWLRRRHAARLRACFSVSPFGETLGLRAYYRSRLALLLAGLRAHGRPVTAAFPHPRVEGEAAYARALASGRPVVLLGLHAGPWELSHRLPAAPADRPFAILTAPAFAPALTAFMAAGRERDGKRILWVGGDGDRGLETGLRSILDSRGVLAMMADQHPGPAEACEFLRLWGKIRSPYPGRLLRFLGSRGCVFVPVSARREAGASTAGGVGTAPGSDAAVLTFHGTWDEAGPERVRTFLEAAIAAAPDQWNWSYPKVVPDR
jgi:lauroyl/myristoyl acyltransferase